MRIAYFVLPALFLVSCGSEPETESVDEQETVMDLDDTIYEDLADSIVVFDGEIYTAEGAVDGPDEELWIFEPGDWDGEVTSPLPDSFDKLHVIPYSGFTGDFSTDMSYVIGNGFQLWGDFKEHDCLVEVFYDRAKTKLAASWTSVQGKPDGAATMYGLDGEVFIQNIYRNGSLMESPIYPYSVDWTFNQSESKLWIKDPKDLKNENGQELQIISYSVREKEPGDNNLIAIMEKESFGNPFEINDKKFTGTLMAYETPAGIDGENLYFELNFEDGLLHGDIKIYSYYMGLKLHETFEHGELDSTIFVLDESQMDGMAKPIIYLYPEKETLVNVKLDVKGEITHTYPKYNDGWNVKASPDGTLIDEKGKEYYALYWEGNNEDQFTVEEGFCVPAEKTAEFLEASLDAVGLNRREANEFIVFWLPILESNPYNLIHFSTDEYEETAKLKVSPQPETMIRVMMVYKPLAAPIDIPLQNLSKMKKERKGFTVVEWGGSLLKAKVIL